MKEAQAKGYAESDPTADVGGLDAARKLVILASIAFNTRVTLEDISVEGIQNINIRDIEYAQELGYVIKLLAIAKNNPKNGIIVRVQPTMKRKQFEKGITQLAQEGAIQVFQQRNIGMESYVVGVVGELQLEVLEYRLLNEYGAQLLMNQLSYSVARWVYGKKEAIENIKGLDNGMLVFDKEDRPVILVSNEWSLNWILERNPDINFTNVPSEAQAI